MANVVWKFHLLDIQCAINVPLYGEILSAGQQNEQFYIWILVDPEAPKVTRNFVIAGTGHQFTTKGKAVFIDRVTMGPYEFHVFEDVDGLRGV